MLAEKMYCVTGLTEPFSCSFKCTDEDFGILTERPGIIPAPYMARHKWVNVQNPSSLSPQEWEHYINNSYQLILSKLPRKIRQTIDQ